MKLTIIKVFFFLVILSLASFSLRRNDWLAKSFEAAEVQYTHMLQTNANLKQYPRSYHNDTVPTYTGINDWTGGFWPGCLWYVYDYTRKNKWKDAATTWTESLEANQFNTTHHDIGFMMYCSYGNAYRLTQNPKYKSVLVQSAKSLITRFNPKVGAIKSWNEFKSWGSGKVYNYPVIIDNMINLELLFFASKVTGDASYKRVAIKHAEITLKNHFRESGSSYHVVCYDSISGRVLTRETAQGLADNSVWARGQAWAIYGYTMMYRETHDHRFLNAAIRMAQFYLNAPTLPTDQIPYWDFNAGQPGYKANWNYDSQRYSPAPRDAAAAAVTCSALLELSTYTSAMLSKSFFNRAQAMLKSLSSPAYLAKPGTNANFLLMHSTGNMPKQSEIDVPIVYADYYYLEALLRYKQLTKNRPLKF
ncbi:glycoside hydrolase family 88 protein [Mucilaginibacter sp. PAMB04274]|uniref:glycoside hydrolase family 88 protein n=1 Tax=Mucilaginibacter sp. PAMB04274 TaxID=3138568 RepID=UPI0031F70C77